MKALALAAALVAMTMASPVMAQTITAPGLKGSTACLGQSEYTNLDLLEIGAITPNSAVFDYQTFSNLYSNLRGRSGDGGPTTFSIELEIHNAKTGTRVVRTGAASITSSAPNFSGSSYTRSGLSPKTPYWATIRVRNPEIYFVARCFMTGGTYTPSNESGQP
ncbi:MAG: hypothetical protein OXC65_01375, partial [Thiotrichales bacterium]|nr:hypothetical protein [Thiotrichales bacterium]